MKAVLLRGYGGVDQLDFTDVPDPVPQADEVLVKVIATSINPIDFKLREGHMKAIMPLDFPFILGRDVAGEVTDVGFGVSNFGVGDKVMGLVNQSYAEYLTTKASNLTLIPEGLDPIYAGVLPLVTSTGAQLIEKGVRPQPGEVVLVTGALGGVGRTAVYVAKQHGASVIAGVRANQKADAESLGADRVVALDDDGEISGLPDLDAIADTIGGDVLAKLLLKLKKNGRLATVLGKPSSIKNAIDVRAVFAQPDSARLHQLASDVRDGKFEIPIAKQLPLKEIRAAQTEAEAGARGKIAILP